MNFRRNWRKLLFLLLFLTAIFISSSQTYEQQSLISTLKRLLPDQPLIGFLSTLEFTYWGRAISVEERGYYYFVEFLIRKSAHFIVFGCLALLIYRMLPNRRGRLAGTLIISLFLALGDEFHQSFTGGRTATLQDVYLDMAGAIVFLFGMFFVRVLKMAVRNLKSP